MRTNYKLTNKIGSDCSGMVSEGIVVLLGNTLSQYMLRKYYKTLEKFRNSDRQQIIYD